MHINDEPKGYIEEKIGNARLSDIYSFYKNIPKELGVFHLDYEKVGKKIGLTKEDCQKLKAINNNALVPLFFLMMKKFNCR